MSAGAIFPEVPARAGMYESFYLRAVSPEKPLGVWIRHTVHKRPRQRARGSVWCIVFDPRTGPPLMDKRTGDQLGVPPGGWIAVSGATLTPTGARGKCGAASWSLRFASDEPELRHLPRAWMYRAPLPRTKLSSPLPGARFDGELEVAGRGAIELKGWPGMVGHNWGAEHAERWIWLHGIGFAQAPGAWLDIALARLRVAGRLTPWVASGALSLDGRRWRLGGLAKRGLRVAEGPEGCHLRLPGERGVAVEARVEVPAVAIAGWRYADTDAAGSGHDVLNCSVAALDLSVRLPGAGAARALRTAHGGAYELGMRERDHGVPIAPFGDG
jgi:hypothetical protein